MIFLVDVPHTDKVRSEDIENAIAEHLNQEDVFDLGDVFIRAYELPGTIADYRKQLLDSMTHTSQKESKDGYK